LNKALPRKLFDPLLVTALMTPPWRRRTRRVARRLDLHLSTKSTIRPAPCVPVFRSVVSMPSMM